MKAVLKRLAAGPLRYVVRQVLQRPRLKARLRDMVTRMPWIHSRLMLIMFQVPVTAQPRISVDQKNLSPQARRVHGALKQAIRTRQR